MFNLDLIQQAEHQCDCLHVNIPFRQSQSKIRHSYLPRNYTCIRIYTCTVYEMGRSRDFEILDRDDFGDSFAYGTPRNTCIHAPCTHFFQSRRYPPVALPTPSTPENFRFGKQANDALQPGLGSCAKPHDSLISIPTLSFVLFLFRSASEP